jgi:FkbM family methyltransferase
MAEGAERTRLVSTVAGRIFVDEQDAGTVARALLLKGRYEEKWTRWFRRVLRPGMHALDIGANVGYYTALFAGLVGADGEVVACEPDPHNCDLLRRTIAENGFTQVRVHEAAVSDRVGTATLYLDARAHGVHSLEQANLVHPGAASVAVPTLTIDQLIDARGRGFDVVKLDAQGAEGRILAAAERLLTQARAMVLIEVWPDGLATFGSTVAGVVEPFLRHGFAAHTFGADRLWTPVDRAAIEQRAASQPRLSSFNLAWVK